MAENKNDKGLVEHLSDLLSTATEGDKQQNTQHANNQQNQVSPESMKVTEKIISPKESTSDAVHPVVHDVIRTVAGDKVADQISGQVSKFVAPILDEHVPEIRSYHATAKAILGNKFLSGSPKNEQQVASNNKKNKGDSDIV